MPRYMVQFAYTPQAWAGIAKNLEDRRAPVRQLMETLGGQLISFYYCRGEYDGVLIIEAPDESTANAASLAAISSGQFRAVQTTELFEVDEILESLRKVATAGFRPPGQRQ